MKPRHLRFATGLLAASIALASRPVRAESPPPSGESPPSRERRASTSVEAIVGLGPGAALSSWRSDRALTSSYLLGLRFADVISIDALTRLGYANVDDRVLTYLSLGATLYGRLGPVRPYARLAAVHQHEEPRSALYDDPGGALFGVGNGIRHRGGGAGSVGATIEFGKSKTSHGFAGADLTSTWFPDSRGPNWYWGAGLWIGAAVSL